MKHILGNKRKIYDLMMISVLGPKYEVRCRDLDPDLTNKRGSGALYLKPREVLRILLK